MSYNKEKEVEHRPKLHTDGKDELRIHIYPVQQDAAIVYYKHNLSIHSTQFSNKSTSYFVAFVSFRDWMFQI
jgi:hypothetical protein